MSIKTPLTARAVRNHFTYGSWKYLILVVAAIAGWNLLYTTTQYRPPEEKRVDIYLASAAADTEALNAWLEKIRLEAFPDMELLEASSILEGTDDDYAATMQLSTFIMAGDGDVFLLENDRFKNYATQGAMEPLDDYLASGGLTTGDLDLSKGYATLVDTGERHLYGIPADSLTGLEQFGVYTQGKTLSVLTRSGNKENAVKFIEYLLTHMQGTAAQDAAQPTATP